MRKNGWKGRTGYHFSPEVFCWKRTIRIRKEGKTGKAGEAVEKRKFEQQ